MEVLDSFNFDERPSRSRYNDAVKAIIDDGAAAVRIRRGDPEFPQSIKIDTVQAGVSTAFRKRGKKARTYVVSADELVVGLHPDQTVRKRGTRKRELAAA